MHNTRKLEGIYYTPIALASPLTDWAIQRRASTVLDPSHGGCAFLHAAVSRFKQLGAEQPFRQVYGADKDRKSAQFTRDLVSGGARPDQFHYGDFLRLSSHHFGRRFGSILGNPPYVRHQLIGSSSKNTAHSCVEKERVAIDRRASYWAYFVVHSLKFIDRDGRLAFVLPGALLYADYAAAVRSTLLERFSSLTALILEDRVFEDAEEEAVLVLAKGFGGSARSLRLGTISLKELQGGGSRIEEFGSRAFRPNDTRDRWPRSTFSSKATALYASLAARCKTLGDVADVRIGTVTGANDYFLLSRAEALARDIRRNWTIPVVPRWTNFGLEFGPSELNELVESGSPCLLIRGSVRAKAMARYLRRGTRLKVHLRHKSQARSPWHAVKVENRCDAFMKYMCGLGPQLTLNKSGASASNSIYALSWKVRCEGRKVALGVLSTITQLSAELEGRILAGGLLKLEPSDAKRLLIPIVPDLTSKVGFADVSKLLSEGKSEVARQLIDDAVVGVLYSEGELEILQAMLKQMRNMRLKRAKSHPYRTST